MSHGTIFPKTWVDGSAFERALAAGPSPHETTHDIKFVVPNGCKIMIDAAVRLLSLCNQLDDGRRQVSLDFEDRVSPAMGYLNRVGFFDHLSSTVEVIPRRPRFSGARMYRGTNAHVVEIARICPENQEKAKATLERLANALKRACSQRPDVDSLVDAGWTIFAELIGNIFEHSETILDGYAALQVYEGGHNLKVAVSDSGRGIFATLRPALEHAQSPLAKLPDTDLLVEIFRQGISRYGGDRGHGLQGSAAKAMKFKGILDVRLPESRVLLRPAKGIYRPNTAYCSSSLPKIRGTHICFSFGLDSSSLI